MNDIKMLSQLKVYTAENYVRSDMRFQHIELTFDEAKAQGWHYRQKSRSRLRITRYTGDNKDIIVPSKIGGMKVNEIGCEAFRASDVKSVRIPNNVEKFGEGMFGYSKVESVVFEDGTIISIPNNAFYDCRELSYVHLPFWLRSIGDKAFLRCQKLEYISISWWCTHIGESCFASSGLTCFGAGPFFAEYPNGRYISASAFDCTPLTENYDIILLPEDKYCFPPVCGVLWAHYGTRVKIDCRKVYFAPKSISDNCFIDLSECSDVVMDESSFSNFDRYDDMPLLLPVHNTFMRELAEKFQAKIADKKRVYRKETNNDPYPSGENVYLDNKSINDYYLRSIHFKKMTAISDEPVEIFSWRTSQLTEISWLKDGMEVTLHIPEYLWTWKWNNILRHTLTLTNDPETGEGRFFDEEKYLKLFKEPVTEGEGTQQLKRRYKLEVAADALRSSAIEYKQPYVDFLVKNRKYAERVIPLMLPEYRAQLTEFYKERDAERIPVKSNNENPPQQNSFSGMTEAMGMSARKDTDKPLAYLGQLRQQKEEHGELTGVVFSSVSSGMMYNSNTEHSISIMLKNGWQEITVSDKNAFEAKHITVYKAKDDVLAKVRRLIDRENLAAWSMLKEKNKMQVYDYSSNAGVTLYFNDSSIGGSSYVSKHIDTSAVHEHGGDEVINELSRMLYEAAAKAEVFIPERIFGHDTNISASGFAQMTMPGEWKCPECNFEKNTGKFCINCGCKKP
jgi:hypothetical protein